MPAVEELPAWSEPFNPETRKGLTRLPALETIDREWAFGGATGKGVSVAIVDSGVEADHPSVRGRLKESWAVELQSGEAKVVADPTGGDLFGHGAACAGIIAGMAPLVDLVSIRVLGSDLKGKGAAFAEALQYAIQRPVRVANLSLSEQERRALPGLPRARRRGLLQRRRAGQRREQRPRTQLSLAVQLGHQRRRAP